MDCVYCFACGSHMQAVLKPHEVEVAEYQVLLDLECYHCDKCQTEGYSQDMEDDNNERILKCKQALQNKVFPSKRKDNCK